ncbi:bile acid:sodium symporter family protein [Paenibacillus sp.]|uniref:bile acid:sodium symporter family protein n=1 Tax=Paenibacillus sp. TaxID=58172 RepID=UPI00281104AE|nr:bile acid:sodium symporter family protein [Paenibacillus sp.]
MLARINAGLEKALPLITPVSVCIGVLLGGYLSGYREWTPWIFAFMTFSGSIGMSLKQFVGVLAHPTPLFVTLGILHAAMPLLALAVGHALYPNDAYTITGLVVAAAIPTGITSFVWVAILKGNTPLTLSIILVDTMLAPFVVPHTVSYLIGAKVQMDTAAMMQGLFWMIVLPSLLGMALHQWTRGRVKEVWGPRLSPFSKVAMGVVVAINASVVAPYLQRVDVRLLGIAGTVLALAAAGYGLGWLAGRWLKVDRGTVVALTLNGGMRNISAGAVLAVTYFAPPVAVPVVLGMLFQQSLASFFGRLLSRERTQRMPPATPVSAEPHRRRTGGTL